MAIAHPKPPCWVNDYPTERAQRQNRKMYDRLRPAKLPDDLATEFEATCTMDLVERINEGFRRQGRPPLPEGSFPSNTNALRRFARIYRDEVAAGHIRVTDKPAQTRPRPR